MLWALRKQNCKCNIFICFQLVASFADIDKGDNDAEGSRQATTDPDNYLFGTLVFVLRDYQASPKYGEDDEYFPKIVSNNSHVFL